MKNEFHNKVTDSFSHLEDKSMFTVDSSKVACLDLEGTLVEGSVWRVLNRAFGVEESIADELLEMFLNGLISYDQWADTLVETWKLPSGGQPTKNNIEKLTKNFEVIDGAYELVEILNDKGYFTVSISGAPDIFSRKVAHELGINKDIPTQRLVFDKNNMLRKVLVLNNYDFSKDHIIRKLKSNNELQEILAVGDGLNDVDMCREADFGCIVIRSGRKDRVDYKRLKSDGVLVDTLQNISQKIKI